MNLSLQNVLDFIRDYGLTITLLLAILIGGARRWWYFASSLEDIKGQYEQRLRDKNEQIERWQHVAEQNGATAQESVMLSKQMKETLDDIRDELREARRTGAPRRAP
jgi:hypothetical protein